MRRGDEVISPDDQEIIRKVFAELGQRVVPEFMAFEEHYLKSPCRQ